MNEYKEIQAVDKNPVGAFHSCTCGQKDPNIPKVTHPLLAVRDADGKSTGVYKCSRCGSKV